MERFWRGGRKRAAGPRPAPVALVAVTSLVDGFAHLVSEQMLCPVGDGPAPLVACCGHRVLAASLAARIGPPCPLCGALADA